MIGREFDPNWFEEIPGTNRSGLLCNQGIEFFSSSAKSIALHLARTSPSFRLRSWRNSIIVSIRLHALVEVINSSATIVLLRWSSSRHRSLRSFVPEKSFVPFFFVSKLSFIQTWTCLTNFISFFFFFYYFVWRINWIQLRERYKKFFFEPIKEGKKMAENVANCESLKRWRIYFDKWKSQFSQFLQLINLILGQQPSSPFSLPSLLKERRGGLVHPNRGSVTNW